MNMDNMTSNNMDGGMGMDMNMDASYSSGASSYTGDDPWYLRTLPGRTGDFMGHFIPGICFVGVATFLLLVALYRARKLPQGKSFSELHIPESNPLFLQWFGLAFMAGTTLGTLYEIYDKDPGFDPVAFTHATLYASYFIVGICALYESQGKLPLDTHRAALVVGAITQALIWHAHGKMKKLPADGALHILLAYINILNAATWGYSIRFPDSVMAFLAGWALLLLQGLWIILSGLYECCIDLHMHDIAGILTLITLMIFLAIVMVVAHYGPSPSDQDAAKFRGKFGALATEENDGDDINNATDVESPSIIARILA